MFKTGLQFRTERKIMEDKILEERLIDIETAIAIQEKTVEELNQAVIEQGKLIDRLIKQNRCLAEMIKNDTVRPQSEETPPPHY